MSWKNVNVRLQKGMIFRVYGDSALIFGKTQPGREGSLCAACPKAQAEWCEG